MNLKEYLEYISNNWNNYREHCISKNKKGNQILIEKTNHPINKIFKESFPKYLESVVSSKERYLIKGSVAQGNLSVSPWIAIMDKAVTSDTKEGYYVVYLVSRNGKYIYLCLGLATHQFCDNLNESDKDARHSKKSIDRVKLSAKKYQNLFEIYDPFKNKGEIDLLENDYESDYLRPVRGSSKLLVQSYVKGTIFYKKYDFSSYKKIQTFTEEMLQQDLAKILKSYRNINFDPQSENVDQLYESHQILPELSDLYYDYDINELDLSKRKFSISKKTSSNSNKISHILIGNKDSSRTGKIGEEFVAEWEKNNLLKHNKIEFANKIDMHCKKKEYPGYDITSYGIDGKKKFIEVKSTKGNLINKFIMTDNEWKAAEKEGENYYLYFVINVGTDKIKISSFIRNPVSWLKKGNLSKESKSFQISIPE